MEPNANGKKLIQYVVPDMLKMTNIWGKKNYICNMWRQIW